MTPAEFAGAAVQAYEAMTGRLVAGDRENGLMTWMETRQAHIRAIADQEGFELAVEAEAASAALVLMGARIKAADKRDQELKDGMLLVLRGLIIAAL